MFRIAFRNIRRRRRFGPEKPEDEVDCNGRISGAAAAGAYLILADLRFSYTSGATIAVIGGHLII